MRTLFSALVCVIFSAYSGAVFASDASQRQCAYEEERSFAFPSVENAGSATVRIIGGDCKSATLVISVNNNNGYGLFAHAAPLHYLTALPADEIGAEDVNHVVARVWSLLGPHPLSELAQWVDPDEGFDDDVLPAVDEATYEAARASGDSYLCVTSFYEGGECYWLDSSGYVRRLRWLPDFY